MIYDTERDSNKMQIEGKKRSLKNNRMFLNFLHAKLSELRN